VTSFTYDSAGHLASVIDPLSTTTMTMTSTALGEASCGADATAASPCSSSQTGPAPVAPGGVITPPSSAPPAGVNYALYDTQGHALYNTVGVYPPGSNTASSVQTDYTLYAGNSITLNGTNVTCSAAPPSPSLPCAQTDASGNVTQLTYDSYGDVTSESTPDGNGSELAKVTYAYDGDGEQTSVTSADGKRSTCQMSPLAVVHWNLCPQHQLRVDLLQGNPGINAIYVFYWPQGEDDYAPIYAKRKSDLMHALEGNNCPNQGD
jgi:YD repeat-containing protein